MIRALGAQGWLLLVELVSLAAAIPLRNQGMGAALAPAAASVILVVLSWRREDPALFGTWLVALAVGIGLTAVSQDALRIRLDPRVTIAVASDFRAHPEATVFDAPGFSPRSDLQGDETEEIDNSWYFYHAAPLVPAGWTPDQPVDAWMVCGEPDWCDWDTPHTTGYRETWRADEYGLAVADAVRSHGLTTRKDAVFVRWTSLDRVVSEAVDEVLVGFAIAHVTLAGGFVWAALAAARARKRAAESGEEEPRTVAIAERIRGRRLTSAAAQVLGFRRRGFFTLRASGVVDGVAVALTSGRRGLSITASAEGIPPDLHLELEARRGAIARRVFPEQVRTGDPDFDAEVFVRGAEAAALAALTAAGRRAASEALGEHEATLKSGALRFAGAWLSSHDEVVERVRGLAACARSLAVRRTVAAALLANVKSDPADGVRAASVRALRRDLPDAPETAEAVEAALSDPSAEVRSAARGDADAGALSIAVHDSAGALSATGSSGEVSLAGTKKAKDGEG